MAISRKASQILWSASPTSASIASSSTATSDAISFDATSVSGSVQVKATFSPAGGFGETTRVRIFGLYSCGDPDADPDSADEWDTGRSGLVMGRILAATNTSYLQTFDLPTVCAKSIKLYVVNNSGKSVTIGAQLYEVLST